MSKLTLEHKNNSKKSSHALAGSNIRKELKFKFPYCKFKVTTESYTGGSSLRVSWSDGINVKQVENIIEKYKYGSFNGMEDIYDYDKEFSDEYGSVKYTFTNRSYSSSFCEKAIFNTLSDNHKAIVKISEWDNSASVCSDIFNEESRCYRWLNEHNFYKEV